MHILFMLQTIFYKIEAMIARGKGNAYLVHVTHYSLQNRGKDCNQAKWGIQVTRDNFPNTKKKLVNFTEWFK
jgi:hypothetical protein